MVAILFASIADGAGITALLPLLKLATATQSAGQTDMLPEIPSAGGAREGVHMEEIVVNALAYVGLEPTLGVLLIAVVGFITIRSILLLIANRHVGYTAAHIATELRLSMLRAVLATQWKYFLNKPIGKLANSMATEANRSAQAYIFGVTMIAMIMQSMVYMAISLAVSWKATLACLGIALILIAVSHTMVRMSRHAGKRQTQLNKSLISRLTDTLQSVKSLKAMAREDLADTVLSAETAKLNEALRRRGLQQGNARCRTDACDRHGHRHRHLHRAGQMGNAVRLGSGPGDPAGTCARTNGQDPETVPEAGNHGERLLVVAQIHQAGRKSSGKSWKEPSNHGWNPQSGWTRYPSPTATRRYYRMCR